MIPPRRSSSRGRLILWYCLAFGSIGAFHPLLSLVLERRGAPSGAIPLVLALFPLGVLIAGPFWGWLADRTGRTARVLSTAMGIAATGALITLLPGSYLALIPGLALIAMSRGGAIALFDVHTIAALGGGEIGRRNYGRVRMWGSTTFIAAVLGAGALAARVPEAPLFANAGLMLALAALTLSIPEASDARPPTRPVRLRELLAEPALARLYLISVLHVAAMSTYDHLFALHGASQGLSDTAISAAVGLGVTAEVAVLYLSPVLLRRVPPWALLTAAVLAGVPRWWVTGTTNSDAVLIAIQAAHGATFGLWWVGGVAYVASRAPDHLRASAQAGFVASGFGLGSLTALVTASQALPEVGSQALFQGLAGVSALAVLLLPWALRAKALGGSSDSSSGVAG